MRVIPSGCESLPRAIEARGIALTDAHAKISNGRLIKRSLTTFGMTITLRSPYRLTPYRLTAENLCPPTAYVNPLTFPALSRTKLTSAQKFRSRNRPGPTG